MFQHSHSISELHFGLALIPHLLLVFPTRFLTPYLFQPLPASVLSLFGKVLCCSPHLIICNYTSEEEEVKVLVLHPGTLMLESQLRFSNIKPTAFLKIRING